MESKKRVDVLDKIYKNARGLYDAHSLELKKSKLPRDLSFSEILYWQQQIHSNNFKLKDRLNLFKSEENRCVEKSPNWNDTFESITSYYTPKSFGLFKNSFKQSNIPFHPVILPFVHFARKSITQVDNDVQSHFTPKAFEAYLKTLTKTLYQISSRAFAADFESQKDSDYDSYCRSFYEGYFIAFYQEYSSMAKMLTHVTLLWIGSTESFIDHLLKDGSEVSRIFFSGKSLGKIKSIKQDDGPTHSILGPNRIITFSGNKKIVYKTKTAQNDLLYNHLLIWLNEIQTQLSFTTYSVLDRNYYSWQEYIAHEPCQNITQVKEYYRRMGFLSALFQILGSQDYHYGNVIARGEHPIFIDHETILNLYSLNRSCTIEDAHILKSKGSEYNLLAAFHHEVSLKMDQVRISKNKKIRRYSKNFFWRGSNIPILQGNLVRPYEFKSQIKAGYIEGLNQIVKHRKQFVLFINSELKILNVVHRYLNRPSRDYLLLLHHSYEPEYLKSGIKRSLFFESLFLKLKDLKVEGFSTYMICQEIKSVEQNFWPRFELTESEEAKMESKHQSRKISKLNYSKKQVKANLDFLSKPKNLEKQISQLKSYFETLPDK